MCFCHFQIITPSYRIHILCDFSFLLLFPFSIFSFFVCFFFSISLVSLLTYFPDHTTNGQVDKRAHYPKKDFATTTKLRCIPFRFPPALSLIPENIQDPRWAKVQVRKRTGQSSRIQLFYHLDSQEWDQNTWYGTSAVFLWNSNPYPQNSNFSQFVFVSFYKFFLPIGTNFVF